MNNSVSNEENKVEEKVSQPEVVISPLGFRNLNPTASIQEPNPEVTNDATVFTCPAPEPMVVVMSPERLERLPPASVTQ